MRRAEPRRFRLAAAVRALCATAALCLAPTACIEPSKVDAAAAAATVEGVKNALLDAFVRKDAAAMASLYAEDAVVIEPDGTILTGRSAIQAALATILPRVRGYSITSQRSAQSGDITWDQETFQVTLGAADDEPTTITGHQIVILERGAAGVWKVRQSGSWSSTPAEMPAMQGMPGMGH